MPAFILYPSYLAYKFPIRVIEYFIFLDLSNLKGPRNEKIHLRNKMLKNSTVYPILN